VVYNRQQEAVRKDAERLYAVWWSRWCITKYPARYMFVPRLIKTAKAVAILHNMGVEHKRHGFTSQLRRTTEEGDARAGSDGGRTASFTKDAGPRHDCVWGVALPATTTNDLSDVADVQGPIVGSARYMYMAENQAKSTTSHLLLLSDLGEHIWADRGRLLAPYVHLPPAVARE